MNETAIATMENCMQKSFNAEVRFPEVVAALIGAGVESYHADLYRWENTYYLPDGGSHTVPMPGNHGPIASALSGADVEKAVRTVQRGEMDYKTFLKAIMAAGTAGYWVYLQGARAVYVGRNGDQHVERFQ